MENSNILVMIVICSWMNNGIVFMESTTLSVFPALSCKNYSQATKSNIDAAMSGLPPTTKKWVKLINGPTNECIPPNDLY